MVQPSNPSERTPSEALASGADPVSEAQRALSGEDAAGQGAIVSKADFDALQKQFTDQGTQLRGLQGALDRSTKSFSDQAAERSKAEHEAWIEQQPEDSRPMLEYLHQQNLEVRAEIASLRQNPGAAAGPDELAKAFVRERGANPDDPRINYSVYDGSDKGTWAFIDSINATLAAPAQVIPAATAIPPAQAPSAATPPGPNDAPVSQGTLTTADDIINWGITTGKFQEADEKLKAIGHRGLR